MADRASASILIGGELPSHLVEAFLDKVAAERGFDGWNETPIDAATLKRDEPLEICGYDKAGGVFEELEAFCIDYGIAFVRSSGSCPGAWGPERVIFEGAGEPRHYPLDEDDQVVIHWSMLDALGSIEAARDWFDAAAFSPPALRLI